MFGEIIKFSEIQKIATSVDKAINFFLFQESDMFPNNWRIQEAATSVGVHEISSPRYSTPKQLF